MSDKPFIDNSGFREFIDYQREKQGGGRKSDDTPIDLLPFIELEMDRINKITKLFLKLKQHQIYPHMDGLILNEKKKNLILKRKVFSSLSEPDSFFLKNFELIVREIF